MIVTLSSNPISIDDLNDNHLIIATLGDEKFFLQRHIYENQNLYHWCVHNDTIRNPKTLANHTTIQSAVERLMKDGFLIQAF